MKKSIIDRISAIRENITASIKDMEQKYNTAHAAYMEKSEKSIEEYEKSNAKEYSKMLQEAEVLSFQCKMYGEKLNELRSAPAINKSEYKALVKEIEEDTAAEVGEACKDIIEAVHKAMEAAERANDTIREANEVLHVVQHELFKEDMYMRPAHGEPIYMATREKKIDFFNPIYFIYDAIGDEKGARPLYKKIIELANK